MSNIQNKIAHFVNFIKHKKRICSYTHYTHRGIHLHLYQNNITYHSTGKTTFIKLNKNTLYVNFNKHKIEYIVIPIIPIGVN